MAATQISCRANSSTLKRSFTAVTSSTPPSPDTAAPGTFEVPAPAKLQGDQYISYFSKRRQSSDHQAPNMPVAAGPQAYQSQFPTFMTVYSLDQSNMEEADASSPINKEVIEDPNRLPRESEQTQPQHQHRSSTSTQASESTDSSPTTTISTADSSSLTDPSPSSSPESPVTIIPLSSFAATTFGIHSLDDLTMSDHPIEQHSLGTISYERPMTSPSPRKPRNTKGLALKLPGIDDTQQTPAPASPSFIKPPIPKPKKKPSILSLQTSANPNLMTLLAFEPPPTPGIARLKHSYSEPQISLFSPDPRVVPEGGMQLPALQRSRVSGLSTVFRKPTPLKDSGLGAAIDEEESPIKTQMATRSHGDIGGDVFDAPASHEDAQSPGYPHGPVEVYSPNVFLYLEPTAEEASKFDVIMNVAREVRNPFKPREEEPTRSPEPKASFDPMEIDRDNIPEPDTAFSTLTFQTAFEYPVDSQKTPTESSPTTPKPISKPEPEYLHIPWDHNTDITKDLMDLCETIEARTKQGKRVLVHCQQGASRSASLIIAYGIYTNPTLSVNDAYHAAQAKSKWISPNMKLMYALQDFQKEVERKKLLSVSSTGKGGRHLDRRSPTNHRTTMSADAADSNPRKPHTAPLPSENDSSGRIGIGDLGASTGHTPVRPSSTPDFSAISPGPSSAPSSYTWTPKGTPCVEEGSIPRSEFGSSGSSDRKSTDDARSGKESSQLLAPQILRPSASFSGPSSFTSSSSLNLTPPATGFGSRRKEHNFMLPSLSLSSSNGNVSSYSICTTTLTSTTPQPTEKSGGDIKPQFVSVPSTGFSNIPQTPSLWSPRIQEMAARPLRSVAAPVAHTTYNNETDYETPPTPSIMSPRVTEFSMTPFTRPPLLSSLSYGTISNQASVFVPYQAQAIPNFSRPRPFGMHSPPRMDATSNNQPRAEGLSDRRMGMTLSSQREVAESIGFATPERPVREKSITPPKKVDPRSPAISGEAGILRSIDDVL